LKEETLARARRRKRQRRKIILKGERKAKRYTADGEGPKNPLG